MGLLASEGTREDAVLECERRGCAVAHEATIGAVTVLCRDERDTALAVLKRSGAPGATGYATHHACGGRERACHREVLNGGILNGAERTTALLGCCEVNAERLAIAVESTLEAMALVAHHRGDIIDVFLHLHILAAVVVTLTNGLCKEIPVVKRSDDVRIGFRTRAAETLNYFYSSRSCAGIVALAGKGESVGAHCIGSRDGVATFIRDGYLVVGALRSSVLPSLRVMSTAMSEPVY